MYRRYLQTILAVGLSGVFLPTLFCLRAIAWQPGLHPTLLTYEYPINLICITGLALATVAAFALLKLETPHV